MNGKIIFSDDLNYLINNRGLKVTKNFDQFEYWKIHRFTLNDGTFFNEINKLSPASYVEVFSNGPMKLDTYFLDCKRRHSYKSLLLQNETLIRNQILTTYKKYPSSRFLLFYSGGVDSTLLFVIMKELGIPFDCILIRYYPRWSLSERGYAEALSKLKSFGVNNYTTIDVDLNEAFNNHVVTAEKEMLLDRHISVHFYETYKRVVEKFGTDIVVVNGQSADSILSFGPSDNKKGSFLQRAILYSNIFTALLFEPFIRVYLRNRSRMPLTYREKLISILDEHNYWFCIDRKCKYKDLLENEISKPAYKKLKNNESKLMYAKIVSFLQGPDNQVVLKAANHFGITRILMPYTAPEFIYNIIKYKCNLLDLFNGKYFVRNLLNKKLKYKTQVELGLTTSSIDDFDMNSYEKRILDTYNSYINQMFK